MIMRILCALAAFFQTILFALSGSEHILNVNLFEEHQVFEGFGTSSCWWSQLIEDEKQADEIARLLYDKETGLGLKTYRYNVGAGENDIDGSKIWLRERRTESFYCFNEATGKFEYDFTRDALARRMLDKAIKYGAEEVILFCNSPHWSMTLNGRGYGGDDEHKSNLPEENYQLFVDYLLTIADKFVEMGYPVAAISPVNEPQWGWNGDYISQEGCHFEPDECVKLLEMFAVEMQKRGVKYELRGPESGQLTWQYYDYIDKYLQSDILKNYCSYYSGHSYWMDNDLGAKAAFGEKMAKEYPGVKFEMSEWCELPQKIDTKSIDSGLWMADIMVQDLSLLNAVSWCNWTAVHGDGLIDNDSGSLEILNRYPVYKQFSRFIKPGMVRAGIADSEENSGLSCVCFKDGCKAAVVIVNKAENAQTVKLTGVAGKRSAYITAEGINCEQDNSIISGQKINLPAKSVVTVTAGY